MPPIRSLSVTKKGLLQRGISVNKKGHLPVKSADAEPSNANTTFNFTQMKETYVTFAGSFKEKSTAPSWDGADDDEIQEKSFAETLRIFVKAYLAYSRAGMMYEWSLLFLSIISCIQFILDTYVPIELPSGDAGMNIRTVDAASKVFEIVLSVIFTFDFLLSLFIADHRWEFFGR